MKDVFKEMVDDLKDYRWWGVDELSEKLLDKKTLNPRLLAFSWITMPPEVAL